MVGYGRIANLNQHDSHHNREEYNALDSLLVGYAGQHGFPGACTGACTFLFSQPFRISLFLGTLHNREIDKGQHNHKQHDSFKYVRLSPAVILTEITQQRRHEHASHSGACQGKTDGNALFLRPEPPVDKDWY